jgi:hypothetical protein
LLKPYHVPSPKALGHSTIVLNSGNSRPKITLGCTPGSWA